MTSHDLRNLTWRKSSFSNSNSNCVEVAFAWRKSSFSNGQANCVEVALGWRKSSFSNSNGQCVEVVGSGPDIAVRDSKNPDGAVLVFAAPEWRAFTAGAAAGEFDPR
jgi:hypothetical protein